MLPDISRLVDKIHDAGRASDAWPEALKSLTDALGVGGAACIITNQGTRCVDWVCFSGLSAEFQSSYIDRYAALDPFAPLINVARGWTKLSECLPESVLSRSEWYTDFVMACGVRDILATRLFDTPSHSAIVGLHQQIGRRFGDKTTSILDDVTAPLGSATLRHVERLFGPTRDDTEREIVAEGVKYYFHVSNGRQYSDETGKLFPTDREAVAHASVLAAELRQDRDWDGFVISVTDKDGKAIAEIPVCL